ncbi:ArsR/SmtB family transcription factor [Levilactobacillus suantsaii]|uniref:Transcriptional regulator n=1 Tax=Levilactobacillus suantsaii TaxID=2292255 RepID=A0A4Q0VGN2_9LACO|nr:metalloregulator ArsR/SmtB family transcription factor [Levilactobacillus suantsaii]QMU08264.1 helix-turn-helix transcriptional regulator [Levilactobacillus suantsaii]RXI76551.1 transcriptional regulator [Levilactobacillus suantsaii]
MTNDSSTTGSSLPSDSELRPVLSIFKAISDPSKMRIILLIAHQALSVSDITAQLSISQSAVSHHLQTLRQLNLVTNVRVGREMHYQVTDQHVLQIFELTRKHVREEN